MKRASCLICAVAFFCCSNDNPVSVSQEQKYNQSIEKVRKDIQSIRELSFSTPVKIGFSTREQYSKEIRVDKRYSDELLRTYKQLCFIPDTFINLQNYLENYYTSFPVAYYSIGTDSITIVDADENDEIEFMVYLSHEFTHALQDQNFGIGQNNGFPATLASNFNSDYYITQRSVIEGDAVVAMYDYVNFLRGTAFSYSSYFKEDVNNFIDSLKYKEIPRYISISSEFPYIFGPQMISQEKNNGGWNSVNQLYHARAIKSSAELITGEKFKPVTFNVSSILENWFDSSNSIQFADDDNYGAVMLMALLSNYADVEHCKGAFGWRGDRLIYMRSNNQPWGKLVWSLAFNTVADAIYVMNGIDQLLQVRKLSGYSSSRAEVSKDGMVTFSTNQVNSSLIRSGSYLFWIENVEKPESVVSNILNPVLSKKSLHNLKINVDPEVEKIKKAVIDMRVF